MLTTSPLFLTNNLTKRVFKAQLHNYKSVLLNRYRVTEYEPVWVMLYYFLLTTIMDCYNNLSKQFFEVSSSFYVTLSYSQPRAGTLLVSPFCFSPIITTHWRIYTQYYYMGRWFEGFHFGLGRSRFP